MPSAFAASAASGSSIARPESHGGAEVGVGDGVGVAVGVTVGVGVTLPELMGVGVTTVVVDSLAVAVPVGVELSPGVCVADPSGVVGGDVGVGSNVEPIGGQALAIPAPPPIPPMWRRMANTSARSESPSQSVSPEQATSSISASSSSTTRASLASILPVQFASPTIAALEDSG
jgi:hypothetical protein